MSDTVKIRVGLGMHRVAGSSQESIFDTGITRATWDAMTEAERQQVLDDHMDTEIDNQVDVWAAVEDSDAG